MIAAAKDHRPAPDGGGAAFAPVDLSKAFDNRGITGEADRDRGALNLWGNSFASGALPGPGARVVVGGVPFVFGARDAGDNVRCARQLVFVPAGCFDWIYVLAAAERRTEDPVHLHFDDGSVDTELLRVSDFWPETDRRFGERAAFACDRMHYPRHVERRFGPTIWRQRIPITREAPLRAVRLPDNPAIHVFAMTAARARPADEAP